MTLAEATAEVTTRLVGNDEADVHCSVCDRRDWYQGIEFTVVGQEQRRAIVCARRYAARSCAELIANEGLSAS